jgi:hypothetical protein
MFLFRAQKRNATRSSGGISLLCSPENNLCPVERRSHSGALRRESRPVQKFGTGRTRREIPSDVRTGFRAQLLCEGISVIPVSLSHFLSPL